MTQKVHGAVYPGVWVEKKTAFVKITFSKNIAALAAADLVGAGSGTVGSSVFGVVESAVAQALKTVETKATILAVSTYDSSANSIDVMLGNSEGWFANAAGLIASALPVLNAQATVTVAGAAPTNTVGALVAVSDSAVTFNVEFAKFDGTMSVGTLANGALAIGPGATSGATPTNSPTGTAGYYPA